MWISKNFSQGTEESLQKVLEPTRKPKVIYTDHSLEVGKACKHLSWNHCASTLDRSETNGIHEWAVRRIKEGTSAVLWQSGLDEKWWADSMECCCNLGNIKDLLSDGKTPYERRFGEPFKGLIIPFGSMVEYHPISAKDLSRLHHFGKKVLPGIFHGYVLQGLGKDGRIRNPCQETQCKGSVNGQKMMNFSFFPIAEGKVKLSGGEHFLRTSKSIRESPRHKEIF